jgi:hypothetical protein
MVSRLLTSEQFQALFCHREEMRHAAGLLRSVAPDHWKVAFHAEKLCERVAERHGRKITSEEVITVLAGFRRVCAVLGPGAQERLQGWIEPLVERLGLADEVNHAAVGAQGAVRG